MIHFFPKINYLYSLLSSCFKSKFVSKEMQNVDPLQKNFIQQKHNIFASTVVITLKNLKNCQFFLYAYIIIALCNIVRFTDRQTFRYGLQASI